MIHPHRLRAPSADGAVLADPPLDQIPPLVRANADRLDGWEHDFQGRRADRLRAMARAEALKFAHAYHDAHGLDWPADVAPTARLVATGHQPELFHPGVWVKNFAAAGLARAVDGVGLNIVVDNDIPKGPAIRVPHPDGDLLTAAPVPFDVWSGEVPYEDQAVRDEGLFASFGDRVVAALGSLGTGALIRSFWPRVLARRKTTDRVGLRFALARRELEAEWGVRNVEVPIGALCESESFLWFACHILAHLPRFQATHNAALIRYRKVYGIRSKNHPVPALGGQEDWLEAPFWVWRANAPRRKPLLARAVGKSIELRIAGEDGPFLTVPLAADRDACCAIEPLQTLPGMGIRLRTRALTTTMFARYLIGDLFLHGIGGAKYDELGDEVARGFLGIEPPRFATMTLTQWLAIPPADASVEHLRAVDRSIRDLDWNPDRHLPEPRPADARAAVEAKWVAIEGPIDSHKRRVDRMRAIRRANEALVGWTEAERSRLAGERATLRAGVRRNALARSREYAFPLHDEVQTRRVLTDLAGSAAGR